jgi:hypothetical protein
MITAKIKTTHEVEIKTLLIDAGVRYWEDATVNGIEDEQGDLIPCREEDRWNPIIDIESGVITNWTQGVVADVHYKICDDGIYHLVDLDGNIVLTKEGYVPSILDVTRDSYGDYIILEIDENGKINGWNNSPRIDDFETEQD